MTNYVEINALLEQVNVLLAKLHDKVAQDDKLVELDIMLSDMQKRLYDAGNLLPLSSVAVQRLIEEVKVEKTGDRGGGYNRTYHRHNR